LDNKRKKYFSTFLFSLDYNKASEEKGKEGKQAREKRSVPCEKQALFILFVL